MLGFSIMVGGVFLSLGCWLAINIKDIVLFFFLFATLFYYNVIGFIFHSLVIYVQACFFFVPYSLHFSGLKYSLCWGSLMPEILRAYSIRRVIPSGFLVWYYDLGFHLASFRLCLSLCSICNRFSMSLVVK